MTDKDFRADRMPSPEGHGVARANFRRAWDAYAKALEPVSKPVARWAAVRWTEDLLGFWLMWHLEGGFEGLQRLGMSRSAVYRRISSFRKVFHEHPDVYRLPGVTLDLEAYLAGTAARQADSAADEQSAD